MGFSHAIPRTFLDPGCQKQKLPILVLWSDSHQLNFLAKQSSMICTSQSEFNLPKLQKIDEELQSAPASAIHV